MDYIAELLKKNPQATAHWANLTWKPNNSEFSGVLLDVNGASPREVAVPEGCKISFNDFIEGADGTVYDPDGKGIYFVTGISKTTKVDWSKFQKVEKIW